MACAGVPRGGRSAGRYDECVRPFLLWCCSGVMFAQSGTTPKQKPEEYEAHAEAHNARIGAEFLVHSFSRGEETFIASDYLVVEVALFPPKGETIVVRAGDFRLRINGKRQLLPPQTPGMVAASLQHPEWRTTPTMEADAGIGDKGVIIGGPPRNRNPFPGSVPPGQGPVNLPRAPAPDAGLDLPPRVKPAELVVETALPEGECHSARSGFLYFAYKGKIGSIKTLELLYQDAVVKLR